eukprot:8791393-Ditylum_brightwellii.AAC.1
MMKMTIPEDEWDKWEEKDKQELRVAVYNKKNQDIKYVNRESCHRVSVFKAIPEGVFTRLS